MNINELFADRLKQAMKDKGYRAIDIVKRTSISKVAMSHYMSGRNRPSAENLSELASVLGVSPEWLAGYDALIKKWPESNLGAVAPGLRAVPVIAYVSCGNGEYNDGEVIDNVFLPVAMLNDSREYFRMYAKGDSMKDVGIRDGDLLIFLRTDVPEQNRIGAFCLDNEYAYCKKYQSTNGKIFLLSANEDYPPLVVEPDDACFRCVGVLKKIMKDI